MLPLPEMQALSNSVTLQSQLPLPEILASSLLTVTPSPFKLPDPEIDIQRSLTVPGPSIYRLPDPEIWHSTLSRVISFSTIFPLPLTDILSSFPLRGSLTTTLPEPDTLMPSKAGMVISLSLIHI